MELDYEKDLAINPHKLEVECMRHPQLFNRYATLLADAELEVKKAEEREKIIRSDLILKAANGEVAELGKATAQTIEAWFRNHPQHKKAKEALANAEHARDILSGAVSAFRMRTSMLETMARLHLSNYYSSPKVEGGSEQAEAIGDRNARAIEEREARGRRNKS